MNFLFMIEFMDLFINLNLNVIVIMGYLLMIFLKVISVFFLFVDF